MRLPTCSTVNESLFIPATSRGFDLPRLGSVYSTVPGNFSDDDNFFSTSACGVSVTYILDSFTHFDSDSWLRG